MKRIVPRSGDFMGQRIRVYCPCDYPGDPRSWQVSAARGAQTVGHKVRCLVCGSLLWTFEQKRDLSDKDKARLARRLRSHGAEVLRLP